MRPALLAFSLATATATATAPLAAAAAPTSAEVAAHPLCIDSSAIAGQDPDGDSAIIFRMIGGKRWRNDLGGACPGLSQIGGFKFLATEQQGTRLCRGDLVSPVDQTDFRRLGLAASPRCPLGEFTELPPLPRKAKHQR